MKKILFIAGLCTMIACNNAEKSSTKDSVEKADSTNTANADSGMNQNTMVVDEASSSFLVKAADGSMTEVQLGEMGQQKATSQRVKDFSAMMVRDHSEANDKVKALASQKNVTLPTSVSDEHQKKMDLISKKSGKDFDKAFMDAMVKDHEKAIDLFETGMKYAKDPDVSSLADKTLPTLKMHLDSAKSVRSSLK